MSTDNPRSDGRGQDGRWATGNRAALGNPNNRRSFELRKALLNAVDDAAMDRVCRKLVELAEAGDMEAIKTMFNYTIGRPHQSVELTGSVDGVLGVASLGTVIMSALAGHPEARIAVAGALMRLRSTADGPAADDRADA